MKAKNARAVGAYHPPRPGVEIDLVEEVVVRLRPGEAAALEALAAEYQVTVAEVARLAIRLLLEAAARNRRAVAAVLFGG